MLSNLYASKWHALYRIENSSEIKEATNGEQIRFKVCQVSYLLGSTVPSTAQGHLRTNRTVTILPHQLKNTSQTITFTILPHQLKNTSQTITRKMVDPSSDPSQHQTLPSHRTVSKKDISSFTFHLTDYNWQKCHSKGGGLFQPLTGVLPGAARRTAGGLCKLRLKEWANREPSSNVNAGSQGNDDSGNVGTRKQKQRLWFNFSTSM